MIKSNHDGEEQVASEPNIKVPLGSNQQKERVAQNNARRVEKSYRFNEAAAFDTEELPDDLVDKLFNHQLNLGDDPLWTQNDITGFLANGEMPPGLTKETLIELIQNAEINAEIID